MSCSEHAPDSPDPRHVAIIMDGNGRWAQQRGLPREEGHRHGVENVKRIVRAAHESNVTHVTLYAFSVENWRRPRFEVEALMRLLETFLLQQLRELTREHVRLHVLGRIEELPGSVQRLLRRVMEETSGNSRRHLALALNYGSRTEVLDAMRAYAEAVRTGQEDPQQLDWTVASRYLYTHSLPDPDLVIRTSGENRISNFLLLQSAYAEYYFSPKHWPEFSPEDFAAALAAYRQRERRFGRTGEQVRAAAPVTQ